MEEGKAYGQKQKAKQCIGKCKRYRLNEKERIDNLPAPERELEIAEKRKQNRLRQTKSRARKKAAKALAELASAPFVAPSAAISIGVTSPVRTTAPTIAQAGVKGPVPKGCNLPSYKKAAKALAELASAPFVAASAATISIGVASPVRTTAPTIAQAGVKGPVPKGCNLPSYKKGELVFPPKDMSNHYVGQVLEGLFDYMKRNWKKEVEEHIHGVCALGESQMTGVREISGGRYEFFVKAKGKNSYAFQYILKKSEQVRTPVDQVTDEYVCKVIEKIIEFAIQQAKTIEELSSGFDMQDFGFIMSYGLVPKQVIHIDLENEEHYQLGLLCSSGSYMTSEYSPEGRIMEKGDNLSAVWDNMPHNLAEKLSDIEDVQKLLDGYGPLLSSKLRKANKDTKTAKPPIGTVLCLPGRVPHCGPEVQLAQSFRAVLFFTATPVGSAEYDVDVQYCRTTLVSDIILHSWTRLQFAEREYMLTRLYDVGLMNDGGNVVSHVVHKHMKKMIDAILEAAKKGPAKRQSLIRTLARDEVWGIDEVADAKWLGDDATQFDYVIPQY